MKYIFFWITLLCTGTLCTPASKTKTQSAEYYVRYLVPEGQLRAEFTLREGSPGQAALNAVVAPGGVRYQGVLMDELNGDGVSYQLTRPGGYNPEHAFTWKDGENQQVFTTQLLPVTSFSFGSTNLNRNEPATFTWEGGALESREALVFLWESIDRRQTVPMEIIGTPGQINIQFPAAKLAELSPGKWTLYLVRKKKTETRVGQTAVSGLAEFYSRIDTFSVE